MSARLSLNIPSGQQQTSTEYTYNPQSQMRGGQTVEMMKISMGLASISSETINTAADRGMNSNPLSQPQPSSLNSLVELRKLMRRNELSQTQLQSFQESSSLESNASDEGHRRV